MTPGSGRRGMNTDELQQFTVLQTTQLQIQSEVREFKGEVRGDIQHLNKLVFEGDGNGNLPLTERMRNEEAFTRSVRFWLRTVAVAIVLQTLTFGSAAAIYFVKLYPLLDKLASSP